MGVISEHVHIYMYTHVLRLPPSAAQYKQNELSIQLKLDNNFITDDKFKRRQL
jgi:hypothetical protein